jgi:hypothetical protein
MSNPLDSRKTKLLMTKTADFSVSSCGFSQIISKKAKITILFLLKIQKNLKNRFNFLLLVFSISPIQWIGNNFFKNVSIEGGYY